MSARPDLTNESIRLQVLLERVKAGEDRQIDQFLQREAKLVAEALRQGGVSPGQTARLQRLLDALTILLRSDQLAAMRELRSRLDEAGAQFAEAEAKSLASALGGLETTSPTVSAVHAAIATAPLGVRGPGGGILLDAFLASWSTAQTEQVLGAIRRGYFEGQTTDQVLRTVVGTRAAKYQDGIIGMSRRSARTVVHTALQHVANTARMETIQANEDIIDGYQWVSTLDSRTSEICRSLDGRKFKVGKGPMPPAHPNCRSTIVPVTKTWRELGIDIDEMEPGTRASADGRVPASQSYYEWLKTQPASFVREALGPTRAALFLKGGLNADDFARLQLNKNFEPLTLEELRQVIPKAFERAAR